MNTSLQLSDFAQRHKTLLALIGGCVLGLLLGLIVGPRLTDAQWTNATPIDLRLDFRDDYLVWVAQEYESTGDLEWARRKLLGADYWVEQDTVVETLATVAQARADAGDTAAASSLSALRQTLVESEAPQPAPPSSEEPQGRSIGATVGTACGIGLLVLAVLGGAVFAYARLSDRRIRKRVAGPRAGAGERLVPAEKVSWGAEGPPAAQFPTTYSLGDDHYDPSFSIELENGEFMGECGVGVSETIGVGAPNKVTAFEVWLFDKSDIRTVTKVLMSDYAFHDEALRTKLAPKGEPMLAEVGADVVLETKTLRVRARVVEVEYGVGNLPQNSFFQRLTVDLAAWVKSESEGTQPTPGVVEIATAPSL